MDVHHDPAIPGLVAVDALKQRSSLCHVLGRNQSLRVDFRCVGVGAVVHNPAIWAADGQQPVSVMSGEHRQKPWRILTVDAAVDRR